MKFTKENFRRAKDLSFMTFGSWKTSDVVKKVYNGHTNEIHWLVECNCGRTSKYVIASNLIRGESKACKECRTDKIKIKNTLADGDTSIDSEHKGIHTSWVCMKKRCYYKKDKSYIHYGEKGVQVCNEWHDYKSFKKWALGNGWEKGLNICRNGDIGNYEPDNCKWLTRTQNAIERNSH